MYLNTKCHEVARPNGPDAVAAWPRCVRNFQGLRPHGAELLPLSELLAWEHERGTHQHPHLTAGQAQLFRHWLRYRPIPESLLEVRAIEEAKVKK